MKRAITMRGRTTPITVLMIGLVIMFRATNAWPSIPVGDCFVAGTEIIMGSGEVQAIETIEPGDIVKTVDLSTMQVENKAVTGVMSQYHSGQGDDYTVVLGFSDGSTNQNTNSHPYFVPDKGWASFLPERTSMEYGIEAQQLEVGDSVLKYRDGDLVEVRIASMERSREGVVTYNLFAIEDNHTFFANGVLVHNKGGGDDDDGDGSSDEPEPTLEEKRRGEPPADPSEQDTPPAGASAPPGAEKPGDPVYPFTGDFIAHYTDIKIPGPGYPFTLERVYTTRLEGGRELGPTWRHSFERRLTMKWDYALEVTNGEGWKSVYMFEADPHIPVDGFGGDPLIDTDLSAGTWAASELNTNAIVRNPDGTFTERTKEGVEYTYAGYRARWKDNEAIAGRLLSIVDKTGHGLSFTYDGEGRITRIEDAVGRNYTFEYVGDRLARIVAPLGMDVRYIYDGLGRLQRVVGLKNEVREYYYDQEGRIDRLVTPSGQVYQYAYDGEDRLVTVHVDGREYNRFTYDFGPNERRTVFTDPRGTDWQYVYDELGRLTSKGIVGRPPVRYEYTDPDNRYNRTAVIDETGRRWTFVYDERRNVVRSTGPDQVSRRYEWGEEYNQLRRVQIDGIPGAWVYSYDERGNLTAAADPDERTRYYSGHGPLGLPRSVANGAGETTSLGYDQWGNLSVIDSPATGRTEMTYDAAGRLIAVKPTGERTTTYDWSPDSREVIVTDSAGETHLYRWDAAGNLVYYDQPGSGAHSWNYNPLGHLEYYTDATEAHYEWTVNLAGDVTAYNPPEPGVWEYSYHPNGQLRTETIPGRGSREYVYDPAGRIERVAGPEGTTSYHYDSAGRLDRVEEPGGIVSEYLEYDPRGYVRRMTGPENREFQWDYNGSGLLESRVDAERRVEYVYDEAGRVEEKRDSVAGTVVYRRNGRGLLESVVYPDETVGFAYDAAGRLTVADDPDMRERFDYNQAGRLSSVAYEDIGKTIHYGYDELGNLLTMTTPEGDVVTYERDPAGRTERFSAPHGIGAVLDWDDRGRLSQLDYANGTAAQFTYDPDNLLKGYSWNGPTGTLLDRSFSYYPDQRLKEMREAQYRWSYRYDEAGRLEEASVFCQAVFPAITVTAPRESPREFPGFYRCHQTYLLFDYVRNFLPFWCRGCFTRTERSGNCSVTHQGVGHPVAFRFKQ